MNQTNYIENKFKLLCNTKSDINEHLPVLYEYASKCDSVIECGVRRCVSSWALLHGLLSNPNTSKKRLLLNDITECDISEIIQQTRNDNILLEYQWCPDIELDLVEHYDLVFIDTWHVYGLLKRELTKFGKIAQKYIIMHDTTVDEISSESVRNKHNIEEKMQQFNFTHDEVCIGLGKAIEDFLYENPNWVVIEKRTNNNGLTVLKRTQTQTQTQTQTHTQPEESF